MKIQIISILIVGALSLDVIADISFDSKHTVSRFNSEGRTTEILPPHKNHFCFLTRVEVEETDSSGEMATCNVRRDGTVWVLDAELGRSSDADIGCSAYCYNL